jgi:DNA invertase Pin-like site-specific DNA recombinase
VESTAIELVEAGHALFKNGKPTDPASGYELDCLVSVAVPPYGSHISGAKGRDQRPQFDALLKAAVRREFNMIAVWSSDRLGRSLKHLVEVLEIIRDTGTGLYIHTQSVDTTTPAGRAMFGMLGIFSEFEREMIVARVNAGRARARDAITRDGHFISKAGKKRQRFGRPNADPKKLEAARRELAKGTGVLKTARIVGLGTGTVQRLKQSMAVA